MQTYRVLQPPTFFSPQLDSYLREICDQVGKALIYIDMRNSGIKAAQAQIQYDERPAAAIFLDAGEINPLKYNPVAHDPLIAHEVTHLQLSFEGWSQLGRDENVDHNTVEKIEAVGNWLTDPLINQRIAQRGFSMHPNRDHEIKESVKALRRRAWSAFRKDKKQGDVRPIRLYVSFSLEPDISNDVKTSFRSAFRKDLPDLYDIANGMLKFIEAQGFASPDNYRDTALGCLERWGVNVRTVKFAEFKHYSPEEQKIWLDAQKDAEGFREWI